MTKTRIGNVVGPSTNGSYFSYIVSWSLFYLLVIILLNFNLFIHISDSQFTNNAVYYTFIIRH